MTSLRRLVVNADDFGFTRDVNEGIVEAHRNGILTAATLMAGGGAFEHAVALARENPGLDVGCHLTLVGTPSVLDPGSPLPPTVAALASAIALRRIRIYDELAAQVRRILDAGITPTHLDTHKHTHLLPPVLDAVARIAEETKILWVRRPLDLRLPGMPGPARWRERAAGRLLCLMRGHVRSVLERRGRRSTDHFIGLQMTGRFATADLVRLIRQLPPGTTELMCHPGRCTSELRNARTRLKESRERELAALVASETREAIRQAGVELVSFRDL